MYDALKNISVRVLRRSLLEERMMVKQQRMMVPGHGERGSPKIDRWLHPIVSSDIAHPVCYANQRDPECFSHVFLLSQVWIWGVFQAGNNLL